MSEKQPKQFSYGGQAVIEGVMMRGSQAAAIAVRAPNGEIHVRETPISGTLYRGWIAKTPFIRGLVGLWDALGLGTRALLWSADVALIEDTYYRVDYNGSTAWVMHNPALMHVEGDLDSVPQLNKAEPHESAASAVRLHIGHVRNVKVLPKPDLDAKPIATIKDRELAVTGFKPAESQGDVFTGVAATGMVVLSLALGIGLFFLLPTATSSGIGTFLGLGDAGTNLVEEGVKLVLFVGYIVLIAQLPDVQRLFQYHGAEHKVINAYEAGAELTPETAQQFPIEHPRCGTAFLLNVIIISIILNTLIGRFDNNLLLLIPARLITIPIVAGIAYEWLRWTAKNVENPIVKILIKPNLMLQRLTTNKPDLDMLEVSITAFERVLAAEGLLKDERLPGADKDARVSGAAMPAEV
ncbi:MAG: DUF1385 domain-containing protein [Anaerolineales bacterium]